MVHGRNDAMRNSQWSMAHGPLSMVGMRSDTVYGFIPK